MMAMPICDSTVVPRPLSNSKGATISTAANKPQISQRATLSGLNS